MVYLLGVSEEKKRGSQRNSPIFAGFRSMGLMREPRGLEKSLRNGKGPAMERTGPIPDLLAGLATLDDTERMHGLVTIPIRWALLQRKALIRGMYQPDGRLGRAT